LKAQHIKHLRSKKEDASPICPGAEASSDMIKDDARKRDLSKTRGLLVAYTNASWKEKGYLTSAGSISQIYKKVASNGFDVSQQELFSHVLW
jgi:hypothetical protein